MDVPSTDKPLVLAPCKPSEQAFRNMGVAATDAEALMAALDARDFAAQALRCLDGVDFSAEDFEDQQSRGFTVYDLIGTELIRREDHNGVLVLYVELYAKQLKAQEALGRRVHKGHPLFNLGLAFLRLGAVWHAQRYLALTAIEDAILRDDDGMTDVYTLLVKYMSVPDEVYRNLSRHAKQLNHTDDTGLSWYPEWILQSHQPPWEGYATHTSELSRYLTNPHYLKRLMGRLGTDRGRTLETIAQYLLSCIPGCRTASRALSYSTDYDVLCFLECNYTDFRSEIGRCFICECKDWPSKRVDFSAVAKLCRVLDSVKAKFGVLLSPLGLSPCATVECLKVYQDRGVIIVSVDQSDLEAVLRGESFVRLLRDKYDARRFHLGRQRFS